MQTSVKVFILGVLLCISLVTALQFGANFIPLDQIISALVSMIDSNAKASMTDTITTTYLLGTDRHWPIACGFVNANGNKKRTG